MKITELRKMINHTNDDLLKKTIVELYKLVPTSKKEQADAMIENVLSGNTEKIVKPVEKVDYKKLSVEINRFLENAYAQNYYAPNRVIPKKDRPKWRFLVKRFVKELVQVSLDDEFYDEAVELLMRLYIMMCYACNYYLFSSTDSFQSVGISQAEFYSLIANKSFEKGITIDKINNMIICAATGGLSRMSLHEEQEIILLSLLNTEDSLRLAVNKAKEFVANTSAKLEKEGDGYRNRYFVERDQNQFCKIVLMAEIKLQEFDEGLAYYFDNVKERDKEVVLYTALDTIRMFTDDNDLWIKCYEYGVKKRKIKPRDSLKADYQEILKNNQSFNL